MNIKKLNEEVQKILSNYIEESSQKNEDIESEELDELIYHINNRVQHLDAVHKMSHNDLAKAIDANDLSKIKSILANCKSYIIAKEIVNTFDRAKKLANTMKKFSLEESTQKNEDADPIGFGTTFFTRGGNKEAKMLTIKKDPETEMPQVDELYYEGKPVARFVYWNGTDSDFETSIERIEIIDNDGFNDLIGLCVYNELDKEIFN